MEELELKDVFNMFWRKKLQIILITLIFMGIGIIYSLNFVTPLYSASTTLILVSSNSSDESSTDTVTTTDLSLNSQLVATYSELVKSKTVIREVLDNLNIEMDENTLKKNISVSSKDDTEMIEITVTNEDAEIAADIANELVVVFSEQVESIYNIDNVNVIDKAEEEEEPSNINHKKDVAIFTFIGLVVAAAYVLLVNLFDTTIKTSDEIEKEYHLPVLASIPECDNLIETQKKNKKGGRR